MSELAPTKLLPRFMADEEVKFKCPDLVDCSVQSIQLRWRVHQARDRHTWPPCKRQPAARPSSDPGPRQLNLPPPPRHSGPIRPPA